MRLRKIAVVFICFWALLLPVQALEAPQPQGEAGFIMPQQIDRTDKSLWEMITRTVQRLRPDFAQAGKVCTGMIVVCMAAGIAGCIQETPIPAISIAGAGIISGFFLSAARSLILLGADTVENLSQYGKLLMPVMCTALAAQGNISTAGALYTGTVAVCSLVGRFLSQCMVPLLYGYLAIAVSFSVTGEKLLKQLKNGIKGFCTWGVRTVLSLFTGYMAITGAVSGSGDAAAVKMTKTAISTAVPVVGGILSGCADSVIIGAQMVKNTVGITGIFACIAIFLSPFLKIGCHYCLLKLAQGVVSVFASGNLEELCSDFAAAMGMLLALTGSECILLIIGCICFLRVTPV